MLRHIVVGAAALVLMTVPAAAETASGAAIKSEIIGNTVTGSMDASGKYAEFYDTDGTIYGGGYAGKWEIQGDTMCFSYDDSPWDCYHVTIDGKEVAWVQDEEPLGTGTIVAGDPNGFKQ